MCVKILRQVSRVYLFHIGSQAVPTQPLISMQLHIIKSHVINEEGTDTVLFRWKSYVLLIYYSDGYFKIPLMPS